MKRSSLSEGKVFCYHRAESCNINFSDYNRKLANVAFDANVS